MKLKHSTTTSPRVQPDLVDFHLYGEHQSYIKRNGAHMVRVWHFRYKRGMNRFLADIPKGIFYREVGPVPPEPSYDGIA